MQASFAARRCSFRMNTITPGGRRSGSSNLASTWYSHAFRPSTFEPYTESRPNRVTFVQTLTGYVPTDSNLEKHVKPLAARPIAIGYRGRPLPFH
jgi:hypothetical protein